MPIAVASQNQNGPKIIKGKIVKIFSSLDEAQESQPLKVPEGERKGLITKVDENGVVEKEHVAPWLKAKVLEAHHQPPAVLKHRTHKNNKVLDKVSVPAEELNPYLKYMNGV